jgi:hypothetical protein
LIPNYFLGQNQSGLLSKQNRGGQFSSRCSRLSAAQLFFVFLPSPLQFTLPFDPNLSWRRLSDQQLAKLSFD